MACRENSDTVADQSVMYVHSLANWQNQLKRAERQVRLMESLLADLYTRLDRAEHLKKPHFVDALKLRIDTVESMLQMYDLFVEYKASQLLSLAAVAGACAELSEEAVWAGTNNTLWRCLLNGQDMMLHSITKKALFRATKCFESSNTHSVVAPFPEKIS